MNILIGVTKNCEVDRLAVWANSAYQCLPNIKKILLCLDEQVPSSIRKLELLNFNIIHIPSPPEKNIDIMKYERHNVIRDYLLNNNEPDDVILTTDTFDVCFQSNPFDWYSKNRSNDLLLGSEGITIENEHWNRGVISKSFRAHIDEIVKNDVFCAGVIMGRASVICDLMLMIYNFTKFIKSEDSEGVDQAALNVLLGTEYFNQKLQVTTTSENFVVHCAVSGPTELFIPWGFKKNYKYDLPSFDGNNVVNKDSVPYCIVHQYNRVKEWDKFFVEKYKKIDVDQSNIFLIHSEKASEHWGPFNVKNKVVLDLGCGMWSGLDSFSQYSPIWFGENGATKVIAVDSNKNDIQYYKDNVKQDQKYDFIEKYISSTSEIEEWIISNEIDALKSDIEGDEKYILDINPEVMNRVKEIAIEYHTLELKGKFISKFKDWGFNLKCMGKFATAGENVGVLFGTREKIEEPNSEQNKPTVNNSTALVICTTPGFSAYSKEWTRDLKFGEHNYILCDMGSSDRSISIPTMMNFMQDNIVNYNLDNVKKSLNFNIEPSDVHRWNLGGGRNIIWFYAHFRMLYFYKVFPNYEYYWFFDDDITFPNSDLTKFLEKHNRLDYDCMITYLFANLNAKNPSNVLTMEQGMGSYHSQDHHWLIHYPGVGDKQPPYITETYGSYFPIVRFSNRALKKLMEVHEEGYYGYSEGFVPTVLNHFGMSLYSIFNKDSKVNLAEDIVIHHKFDTILWKNI